jgi:hypothetical protein
VTLASESAVELGWTCLRHELLGRNWLTQS